jgi:hypothetical protein
MATEIQNKYTLEFTDMDGDTIAFGNLYKRDKLMIIETKNNVVIIDQQNIRTLIAHLQKQLIPCTTQ